MDIFGETLGVDQFNTLSEDDKDILRLWVMEFLDFYEVFSVRVDEDGWSAFGCYKRNKDGNCYWDENLEQVAQYTHLTKTGVPPMYVAEVIERGLSNVRGTT